MIKLYTKAKLLPTKNTAYYTDKKAFARKLSMQIFFIAVLSSASLVVKYYYDTALESKSNLKIAYKEVLEKHITSIKDNIAIDKALSDFTEIKTAEQEPLRGTLISDFTKMLSYLSFYYGVSDKINIKIEPPLKITPDIARIKISLSFKSKDDSQTMPILDSIIMNAKGFVFVERIEIKKASNNAENNIDLYWYTSTNIEVSPKEGMHFYVVPKKYPHTLEEEYRISLWNGRMIS